MAVCIKCGVTRSSKTYAGVCPNDRDVHVWGVSLIDEDVRVRQNTPRKDDKGKRQWRLLPWEALGPIADVLTWACTRETPPPYGPESWRGIANAIPRYQDALQRHLSECYIAYREGRGMWGVKDDQSDLPSLAHAGCDLLFLIALSLAEEKVAPPGGPR
jgi:hypothetical protein